MTNGTLSRMVRAASGNPVRCETVMPMPITPPSRMVFGTRNSSTAKAAMADPSARSAKVRIGWLARRFKGAPFRVRCRSCLLYTSDPFVDQSEIPEDVRRQMSEDFKWSFAYDLYFHHRGLDGGNWFSSAQESEGTKAALAFFSVALRSLEQGDLTVIDELDLSLHPTLLRDFVALFSDEMCIRDRPNLLFLPPGLSISSSLDMSRHLLPLNSLCSCCS